MTSWKGIPGPKRIIPIGNALQFIGKQPWDVCSSFRRDYGGMALIWLLWKPVLVLNDPDLIEEVLISRREEFYKGYPGGALGPVVKNNLFVANAPAWATLREQDPLHNGRLDPWLDLQLPVIWQELQTRLAGTVADPPVDAVSTLQRHAFAALNSALVGTPLDGVYRHFVALGNTANRRMLNPFFSTPPLSPIFYAHQKKYYAAFDQAVDDARRSLDNDRHDLLSTMLRQDTNLDSPRIAQSLASVPPGGVYTFAAFLGNTIWLLSQHPAERQKLVDALRTLLNHRSVPTAEELTNCVELDQVVRESMRLIPPVPMFSRNVDKNRDARLGGHTIPADTLILLVSQALQRCPQHWQDADQFQPSRWTPDLIAENPYGSSYFFPFGRGPRTCVGNRLSLFFLKVALAVIYSQWQVTVSAPGKLRQSFYWGIARPKGIRCQFRPLD